MVFTLTASRMVTAGLFVADGWLEVAVRWRPRSTQGRCRYDGRGLNPDTTVTAPLARSRAATSTTACRILLDVGPAWLISTNWWPISQPSLARYSQAGNRYSTRRTPAGRPGRFMISTLPSRPRR